MTVNVQKPAEVVANVAHAAAEACKKGHCK